MNHANNRLYLYDDSIDLVITADNLYVDNKPMNNKSLIAHKGLTNTINFNVRNRDRKLQSVFTDEVVAYIVNPASRTRLLTKRLETTSDVGLIKLHLTDGDLQDIDAGLYCLYITRTNSDGTDLPIYSNQNNDVAIDIQISEQAVFEPIDTQFDVSLSETSSGVFVSDAFFGNLDRNFKDAQHSVAIYHSTYTGNIKIQASCLVTTPQGEDNSHDWFDVTSNIAVTGASTDILHRTFALNCNWVRVISYPNNADSTISNIHIRN